jgi:hypothetical protein
MSRTVSPSSQQPYGVARVTTIWNRARSSFYAARHRQQHPQEPQKRGPKVLSDEELVAQIRQLLAQPVFTGEGYRKIWARLRHKGIRTCKDRVLRLLREHQLLSPSRQPEPVSGNPHEGTIVTTAPDQMWGTQGHLHGHGGCGYCLCCRRSLHRRVRGHPRGEKGHPV